MCYIVPEMEYLYTSEEVAKILRLNLNVVQGLLREGELRGTRTSARGRWRIPESSVEEFLKRFEVDAREWDE